MGVTMVSCDNMICVTRVSSSNVGCVTSVSNGIYVSMLDMKCVSQGLAMKGV